MPTIAIAGSRMNSIGATVVTGAQRNADVRQKWAESPEIPVKKIHSIMPFFGIGIPPGNDKKIAKIECIRVIQKRIEIGLS